MRKEREKILHLGGEKNKLEKMVEMPGHLRAHTLVLKASAAVPSWIIRHKWFLSSCLFSVQYSSLCINSGIYSSVRPDLMQRSSSGILLEQV